MADKSKTSLDCLIKKQLVAACKTYRVKTTGNKDVTILLSRYTFIKTLKPDKDLENKYLLCTVHCIEYNIVTP